MTERSGKEKRKLNWEGILFGIICPLFLALYPMRHINWGLDLWDTGYNYSNFQYMGTEHMDNMWLFSTYLATAVGSFLQKLPFAGTLVGMNFYTGLFVSALALTGYWFCIKKLHMPAWIAFLGEVAAVCLCWCPTALLYNYLTYVLFLAGCLFLYQGLSREKNGLLVAAGICLGTNVLVRFSNLAEAGMIVAVWAYGIVCAVGVRKQGKLQENRESFGTEKVLENREQIQKKETEGNNTKLEKESIAKKGKTVTQKEKERKRDNGQFLRTVEQTLWCLAGYAGALAVWLLYIGVRYGLDNYMSGIQRLFGMTENAQDYTAASMLMGMVWGYVENMYWVIRLCLIILAGIIGFAILPRRLVRLKKLGFIGIIGLTLGWLYYRGFCNLHFNEYNAMLRPGILFLMLAILIGVIQIFQKGSSKEEKLLSGMVILIIFITCLGSNNALFPSLNNLFLAGPYVFWYVWRFCRSAKESYSFSFGKTDRAGSSAANKKEKKMSVVLYTFPLKAMAVMLVGMLLFQSVGFSTGFVFVEAAGASNVSATVDNNTVLAGVKMSPERAEWMEGISEYVNTNGLAGKEVLLYGQIPALSYYLQMPPAFNSWSDLRSFSLEAMEEAMDRMEEKIIEKKAEAPVVILERKYADYLRQSKKEQPVDESLWPKNVKEDQKFMRIMEYLERYGYSETYANDKFLVLETKS